MRRMRLLEATNVDVTKVGSVTSAINVGAVSSSSLPTGASTEATLALVKAKTDNLDILLSALRDALLSGTVTYPGGIDDVYNALLDPILDTLIHNNATINAASQSSNQTIKGAKHVDVLIRVGTKTLNPTIQFHVDVIEPTSGAVIRTYSGTSLSTADTSDYITIDNLTLGTTIRLRWTGTLDASNYFSGVYARLVAKR